VPFPVFFPILFLPAVPPPLESLGLQACTYAKADPYESSDPSAPRGAFGMTSDL
jgi:hypothetical protein